MNKKCCTPCEAKASITSVVDNLHNVESVIHRYLTNIGKALDQITTAVAQDPKELGKALISVNAGLNSLSNFVQFRTEVTRLVQVGQAVHKMERNLDKVRKVIKEVALENRELKQALEEADFENRELKRKLERVSKTKKKSFKG